MSNVSTTRERSQIPKEYQWSVEDLYATDEVWAQDLERLKADSAILAGFAGRLGKSGGELLAFLEGMEQTRVRLEKLANYCMRRRDEDTRQGKYQEMSGQCMSAFVSLEAAISFETPEILAISDDILAAFYAVEPKLERYRRYLTNIRRRKAHILSPAEEKLLAAAGEMAMGPENIHTMLTNSDIRFPDAVDSEGVRHPMSHAAFGLCEESGDRVLRKSAFDSMYGTLDGIKNTAAAVLNAQVKQLYFFADARKYPSTLEASLDETNVPTSVYLNLIEAVHKNLDKMHRYVRLRKKLLGVDELHFYDVYARLVPGVEKDIPYEDAVRTVCEALKPLGEDYCRVLRQGFKDRWVDVYPSPGKLSGAYSAGAAVHPLVLMNYTGALDSQFTLAHEMGHAMHSWLSWNHQNPIDADYVIFVAEVASTCNEALLMEYLLARTTDKKERAYLINHFMEQLKGTIYRQAMFAEFELNINRMVQNGQTLTADVLCAEYKRLNEMYFGPDMVVDDQIALEWARIPHFYYNFYVFQYATGYAAAIALSQRILREGEPAVRDYLGFLSGGCSKSPIDLLKGAGVDMTSTVPVEQALALMDKLLDEMEQLVED